MNTKILTFLLVVLALPTLCHQGGTIHAQENGEGAALQSFAGHLKSGNTRAILSMLTEPFLSEQRELLEANLEYPQWLRNFYKNVSLQTLRLNRVNEKQTIADIAIDRKNNEPLSKTRLVLKLEGGVWKISEEVRDF